jgi:hypothetical protein
VTDRFRADGVAICNPVEAIVACRDCQKHHEQALAELPRADVSHPKAEWSGEEGG